MPPSVLHPFVLYQSARLQAYANRLIHGFTGKPVTMGGPDFTPEYLAEQRRTVSAQLGLTSERLILPHQIHSDTYLTNAFCRGDQGDAVIVTEPGLPAMIQVADCVPVLLYDPIRHAGAAVHAGWRGTAARVAAKVAESLIRDHGARPENIIVAIGPAIGGCCYEVSDDVATQVAASLPEASPEIYTRRNADGRPQIDLKTVNRLQLEALGISEIDILPDCTRCETDQLWSYRRGEAGRQVAFLELRPLEG